VSGNDPQPTLDPDSGLVHALSNCASALSRMASVMEADFAKRYPEKPGARDATVSYIPTREEQLREDQGHTGEPSLAEWTSLGRREQAFLRRPDAAENRSRAESAPDPALPGQTRD